MARTKGSKNQPKTVLVPLYILNETFNQDHMVPVGKEIAELLSSMGKEWEKQAPVIEVENQDKREEKEKIETKLHTWDDDEE